MKLNNKIQCLISKGVIIPAPFSVEIGDEVDPDRISPKGVVIHSGSRLQGEQTYIASGAQIGSEGPVTIDNCWIGPDVKLKGGFFSKAVFLEKASAGSGSHVREGTILEEEASIAHTVGLKQTILFPFVTLGSLINFCDCLMAGGTSRKNHSEVGSSYIHFNYTPNQDKATASLLGDVPAGVMLNKKPVFLGGQGGLVGPCRLNYGTVVAAGTIQRQDELKEDRLLFGGGMKRGSIKAPAGVYTGVKKIVQQNINYIGNLIALLDWYEHVRQRFISDVFPEELYNGLVLTLNIAIDERVKRFKALADKFRLSLSELKSSGQTTGSLVEQKQMFIDAWTELDDKIMSLRMRPSGNAIEQRTAFLGLLDTEQKKNNETRYIDLIQGLDSHTLLTGTTWLQSIVDHFNEELLQILPLFK